MPNPSSSRGALARLGFVLALALIMAVCAKRAHAESPIQFIMSQARSGAASHGLQRGGSFQTMVASWYGGGEKLNRFTSTGERFNPLAPTCAHRTLPFGTRLEVTFHGKSTMVRVNDRGSAAYTGRSLDLSRGAAADIGLMAAGSGVVVIRILN